MARFHSQATRRAQISNTFNRQGRLSPDANEIRQVALSSGGAASRVGSDGACRSALPGRRGRLYPAAGQRRGMDHRVLTKATSGPGRFRKREADPGSSGGLCSPRTTRESARLTGRLVERELLQCRFGGFLFRPELVVIEDPHCLDHVRHGDALVTNEEKILSVRPVCRAREVVGADVREQLAYRSRLPRIYGASGCQRPRWALT